MPTTVPAMLEGYASTRPPRTEQQPPEHTGGTPAGTRRRHPIRKDQR